MATTLPRDARTEYPEDRHHKDTQHQDRATQHRAEIPAPPLARWLFLSPQAAWLWLPLRLYLGWSWMQHGLQKAISPAWTESADALAGFWGNAVTTDPKSVITVSWYRAFIESILNAQAYTWFSDLV